MKREALWIDAATPGGDDRSMIRTVSLLLPLLALPVAAVADGDGTATNALCVHNASARTHIFVAEAPGAGREVAELQPGGQLCVSGAEPGAEGVVSVFENSASFEGCSRIVPVGRTESMKKYVEFDRCFWSSNS